MKLSAVNILRRSHYGLKIYAYVLAQHYQQAGLQLTGMLISPVRNPFTGGRKSLLIELRDGCSFHKDLEQPEFKGDVFDFANFHFKCESREELYYMINQVLHLGLLPQSDLDWLQQEDDSWRPLVSYFEPPISNILPAKELSLAEVGALIGGPALQPAITQLRRLQDPGARRRFKATRFPYVTFSGRFGRRNEQELLEHSGLLALDLDHLPLVEEIRQLLLDDDTYSTELLFLSPSGQGLKWVLRFDPSQRSQQDFFRETAAYLRREYRLKVDEAAKDVSRACFLAWDEKVFLHPRHRKSEEGIMKKEY